MLKKVLLSCWAVALVGSASAATFFPSDIVAEGTFNWGSGPDGVYEDPSTGDDINNLWGQIGLTNGGTVAVTGDFPRSGLGSLRFAANGQANTKAGVAYYPPYPSGFGPLSGVTAASYDWFRSGDSDPTDGAPVMRIFLFEPDTDTHVATLLWQPQNDGIAITSDTWASGDVFGGTLWNSKGNSPVIYALPQAEALSFAELQDPDSVFSDLIVRAIEIGYGSGGWGPNFVGAADNVVFTGSEASVNDNFEVRPQVAVEPTPVPSLGEWALILLSTVLGGLALLSVRRSRRV